MTEVTRELRRAYMARSRPVEGGHRRWYGPRTTGGTPVLFVGPERYTVSRAGFLLAQEREPVGYVKSTCGEDWCVAKEHQADREMREEAKAAARAEAERLAAEDVDDWAVELAVAGRLPSPRLSPAEKRAAVRAAPATMPVIVLARRIGACSRTVKALRAELQGAVS